MHEKGVHIESKPASHELHGEKPKILNLFDFCTFILIILPASVIFTASTWDLSDQLEVKVSRFIPIVGVTMYFILNITPHFAYDVARHFLKNKFLFSVFSKLYIYVFATFGVSQWNYVWEFANSFKIFSHVAFVLYSTVTISVTLFICRRLINLVGGHGVADDSCPEDVFLFPTMFETEWKKNKFLYILDSIFSVFIVGTLVILVWRGAWCLLDQTIFPGNETYLLSGWISLGIGYSIVFATFALQRFMKILIRMYHGWKRLVIIDTYVVISFCGTINIWRGIWILLEEYVNLENSLTNCVILHFLSFFILVIFNSSNTLLVRGVYIDAEENGEDCVEFPCYYFRLRFQEKQKKKTLVELNNVTNKVLNVEKKDDCRLNDDRDKKSETEIISEINHQQVPLIVNDSPNTGNGEVNSNNDEKPNS
ncbi:uncharacterized protein fusl isoform X3 [Planococcus citri]|uniref:uncharacterized protein fusl isoform X3 n=1 Tax=Planococcus citri TaxID=170843 RepID=UPI0031F946CF